MPGRSLDCAVACLKMKDPLLRSGASRCGTLADAAIVEREAQVKILHTPGHPV
jgi:hypothetical protein